MPLHQKEFETLFEMSLEKYKRHYEVKFINKTNRQQMYSKLRTKLVLDFLCNLDFLTQTPMTAPAIYTTA